MSDADLRRRARSLLFTGLMPEQAPAVVRAPSDGRSVCKLCTFRIPHGTLAVLEAYHNGMQWALHPACYAIVEQERQAR